MARGSGESSSGARGGEYKYRATADGGSANGRDLDTEIRRLKVSFLRHKREIEEAHVQQVSSDDESSSGAAGRRDEARYVPPIRRSYTWE